MKKLSESIFILLLLFISGCSLDEKPVTSISKDEVFSSEEGLKTYSYSFYNYLPTGSELHYVESTLVDYCATNSLNTFISKNAYSETQSSGWSWNNLRNINYFIVNCNDEKVSEKVRNNYIGIARFFRAYFYFDMVKKFGDVPWIDKPLDVNSIELYKERDSREFVMEKVYEDIIFACNNITTINDATGTLVTKWAAYALASRIALFEGTFRKYHSLKLNTSYQIWLERAYKCADYIIQNSSKKIYESDGPQKSYRKLFTSDAPITSEIILAVCSSNELSVYHDANWKWTSATYGTRANLIRPFINTYLQLDGTPYTSREGWETETFSEECKNRDYRLSQSIRVPGYTREGKLTLPDYGSYARLGYQPIKLCVDATIGDTKSLNTNALTIFRFAEVLLNYAEAKAELNNITDDDWKNTIGILRRRAGITGGLDKKPILIDSYFQQKYFPNITNPTILEIRRERSIELLLEGFRFDDLLRWKCGNLLTMSWSGINIPNINQALDMDNNGTPDVIYYTNKENLENAKSKIDWNKYKSSCSCVQISTDTKSTILQAKKNSKGYYLCWLTQDDNKKVFGEKQYFYPIPSLVMEKNKNIIQNKGWENGATNDGN